MLAPLGELKGFLSSLVYTPPLFSLFGAALCVFRLGNEVGLFLGLIDGRWGGGNGVLGGREEGRGRGNKVGRLLD